MLSPAAHSGRVLTRVRTYSSLPPPTYFGPRTSTSSSPHPQLKVANPPKEAVRKPLLELATVLSVIALSFFAIDNYRSRLTLELKMEENAVRFKEAQESLAQQANAHRKKRELQILNERKLIQTRDMKAVLHVAMLRKQLTDAGIEPVAIAQVLQEFEKNVRMENSVSNVSGTRLWLTSDSESKAYISDIREYDGRK
ncbi:LADA_0F13190g1_1 [Lachancea dasiensis]|uniref:LADA_0F13190g1_1 n=1 Tax=Lachancea dasiensis TaxID=1072105 RepID=A0A1G4JMZ3_9SACH|nr:LADA_0F13190g1_1 [Lachancea dasiensis]